MKKPLLLALCAVMAFAAVSNAAITTLQPVTTFGPNGNGSFRPDQTDGIHSVTNFTSNGSAQRALAYNPVTGHLLFVSRTNYTSPTDIHIYVLDAATGTNILDASSNPLTLDITSFLAPGGNPSFDYNMVACADDGSIYACNLSSAAPPPQFRLYRWENETAAEQLVYAGDPGNGDTNNVNRRWGDTLTVRGGGLTTQILIASRGSLAAVLTPTDASLTAFTAKTLQTDVTTAEGMGYALSFGVGNTFWAKGASSTGLPLLRLNFDLNAGTATTVQSYSPTNFPGRVGALGIIPSSNLLAAIEMVSGADLVRLYDISNISSPVLLDRKIFATNINNNIFAGAVAIGANNTIYALDTDNGVMAFNLGSTASNPLAPVVILQPADQVVQVGSNVVFSAAADGSTPLSYQWYFKSTNMIAGATNGTYIVNNAQLTNTGNYTFVASNASGSATSSVATLTVLTTSPALIVSDFFNYTPGAVLGTPNNWVVTSGASGTIEAGNLNVPGLAPSTGNRYTWSSATSNVRLPIGTNISGTVYFSLALRIDTLGEFSGSDTIAGLGFGTSTGFSYKLNVQTNGGGGYNLGVFKGAGTVNGSFAPNNFSDSDVVFIVGRYTFNTAAGNDDTCDLWLNPSSSTFGQDNPPAPTIAAIGAGVTDNAQIDRFLFRAAGGPTKHTADELRVGVNWASVTPPAVIAQPKLAVALSGASTILSWPTNATGFSLQSSPTIAPTSWSAVANSVVVNGTNNTVTANSATGSMFFRLIK
jgi:Immunoglobulin domain